MNEAVPDPLQWQEAQRWFAKASEDLQMARLAMRAPVPLTEPAAYHCQQAVEKLIKGVLTGCGIAVPRTHDLERLARLLGSRVPEIAADIQCLVVLSPWAEVTRYPQLDSDAGVSDDDVRQAISDLEKLSGKVSSLVARMTSGDAAP